MLHSLCRFQQPYWESETIFGEQVKKYWKIRNQERSTSRPQNQPYLSGWLELPDNQGSSNQENRSDCHYDVTPSVPNIHSFSSEAIFLLQKSLSPVTNRIVTNPHELNSYNCGGCPARLKALGWGPRFCGIAPQKGFLVGVRETPSHCDSGRKFKSRPPHHFSL